MCRKSRVNIFLAVVATVAIIFAIFALSRNVPSKDQEYNSSEYDRNIKILNDTIQGLRQDIAKYESEIKCIELERSKIKKELELILKDNEKVDTELSNGSWDYNIRFLSDYLSEKDTNGE